MYTKYTTIRMHGYDVLFCCVCAVCRVHTRGVGQPQLYYIRRCLQRQLHCHDKVQYMSYQLYVADTHILFDQFCDRSLR